MKTRSTYFALAMLVILSMVLSACAGAAPAAPAAAPAEQAAPAGEFNWRAHEGESLKLLLNPQPYQQALVGELPKFTELTGIEVTYDAFPCLLYTSPSPRDRTRSPMPPFA